MLGQRLAILLSALLLAGTCARAATTHEVADQTELDTALTSAADGDTIRLTGDISITSDLTAATTPNLTLDGGGYTVDGDGKALFRFNGGLRSITDISITGGVGSTLLSGAVDVRNDLTGGISNSTFTGNKGSGHAGAVHVANDLNGGISGSTFTRNTTTSTASGGAVYVGKDLTGGINASTFTENETQTDGGAVAVRNGSLTGGISDSTFTGNKVWSNGGAVYIHAGSLTDGIRASTFTENEARADGGAVNVKAGSLTGGISASTFSGNTAGNGGGAVNVKAGSLTGGISASTFTGNKGGNSSIDSVGGAVRVGTDLTGGISASTFTENTVGRGGGAVYVGNDLTGDINASTFTENTVTSKGSGGAVYVERDLSGAISASTFTGNTADYVSDSSYGGAVYVGNDLTGGISASTFTGNMVGNSSAASAGGAVYVGNDLKGGISDSTLTRNTATEGSGGAVYVKTDLTGGIRASTFSENKAENSGADSSGGALYVGNDLAGGISDSMFTKNTADNHGGAVYVYNGLTGGIRASTFTGNKVTDGSGGAVYVETDLTGGISDATFTGNTADRSVAANASGGAVYVGNDLTGGISASTFTGNTASSPSTFNAHGGAVYVIRDLTGGISASTFSGNKANGGGGAVYVRKDLTGGINASTFTGNTTGGYHGGAVYVDNDLTGGINASTFTGNKAGFFGGAVYVANSLTGGISDSTFSKNSAGWNGGAVYIRSAGELVVADSTFTANQAEHLGGAVYVGTDFLSDPGVFSYDVSLTATQGKTLLFRGNTDKNGSSAIHFGRSDTAVPQESVSSIRVDIAPERGGTVRLLDPITVDMSNSTNGGLGTAGFDRVNTFSLAVGGEGAVVWGGTNDIDSQGGASVLFRAGSDITLASDFQLNNRGLSTLGGGNGGALAVTFESGAAVTLDLAGRAVNRALFWKGAGAHSITGGAVFRAGLYEFDPVDTEYLLVANDVVADHSLFSVEALSAGYAMELVSRSGALYLHADNDALVSGFLNHSDPNVRAMYESGALSAAWKAVPADQREGLFQTIQNTPGQFHNEVAVVSVGQTFSYGASILASAWDLDKASFGRVLDFAEGVAAGSGSGSAYASLGVDPFRGGLRFWGGYAGARGRHDSSGGVTGVDSRSNSVVVGAGYDFTRQFGVSVYYSHGRAHADAKAGDAHIRSTLNMAGGRVTVRPTAALRFDLDGYFLHADNVSTRRNALGAYRAEYDGRSWGVALRAGYDVRRGCLTVTPWADVTWQRLSQDRLAERGTALLASRLGGVSGGGVSTRVGVDASYRFALANGRSVTPRAHAVWTHDFGKRQWGTTAGFVGATPTYTMRSAAQDRNSLGLGGGVEAAVYSGERASVSVYAGYDFVVSRRFTGSSWNMGAAVRF